MRLVTLLLLSVIINSAYAEVYKCQAANKKMMYQSMPCSANTVNQGIVEIEKQNAQQQEEAKNRLKATEEERQALDKAAQTQRETSELQQQTEAARREAAAARQEAAAARRAAEQAQQQGQGTTTIISPYPIMPYPNYGGYRPNYNPHYNQNPAYTPNRSPHPSGPNFSPYQTLPPPYMPVPTNPYR